ncbi:MAG: hypothetical protein KKA81_00150 [Bacteroidetes bacterium]|nr:hypothetical protein [Bacteroidota bacterium]
MGEHKRKKKRRKIRYKKVEIKLSSRQVRSLENYCKARKITPNKLIRKVLKPYLHAYVQGIPEGNYATPNQLNLFKEGDEKD